MVRSWPLWLVLLLRVCDVSSVIIRLVFYSVQLPEVGP